MVKTNALVSETARARVKTELPRYVRVKFAKGRAYYYFDTGKTRDVLTSGLTSVDDLYFFRAGDAVKIGRAGDVFKRMVNTQANNHLELDCVCRLPRRGYEEHQWHAYFRDVWIRGEWFDWIPEIAAAIELARKDKPWWAPA
jgi:hypothetical protein